MARSFETSIDTPLVSILTPVYNGEKYLRECVESVLNQTYENWEYIIINNCSTDSTKSIAEEYASRDTRIRVHNNEKFVGSIANHNLALQEMASGSKYCKMVHADDWLFPNCIQEMVKVGESYPSVGVIGAYGLWGERVKLDGLPYPSTFVVGHDICRAVFLDGLQILGNPTSTLFRASLVRNPANAYNENNIHADTEACIALLSKSDFGFVHQVLTFTRLHEKSITSRTAALNTPMPGHFEILLKYGKVFLTPEETNATIKKYLDDYYRLLGRRALLFQGTKYWKYHREAFERFDLPFNYIKICSFAAIEAFKLCFDFPRLKRILRKST